MEWNAVRRTAEFFDGSLASLRAFGITAGITLLGISFRFQIWPLFFGTTVLSFALAAIDRRHQTYLKATADYALCIEKDYQFADRGLTTVIAEMRTRQGPWTPENIFLILYILLGLTGIALLIWYRMF